MLLTQTLLFNRYTDKGVSCNPNHCDDINVSDAEARSCLTQAQRERLENKAKDWLGEVHSEESRKVRVVECGVLILAIKKTADRQKRVVGRYVKGKIQSLLKNRESRLSWKSASEEEREAMIASWVQDEVLKCELDCLDKCYEMIYLHDRLRDMLMNEVILQE